MKASEVLRSLRSKKERGDFRVGDTVRVHVKIREGEKERIQVFEGTVIKRRRGGEGASFTVRKLSYGVGVERVFPFQSDAIERIEFVQRGKVRRARLYYLRKKQGRDASLEEMTENESTPGEGGSDTKGATSSSTKTPKMQAAGATAS